MRPLFIAVPVWLTFAAVSTLYLYYAGRVTRRLREFHGEAWERLSWLPRWPWSWPRENRKYYEPNPSRGLSAIIWYGRPRLGDSELDRLASKTRVFAVLTMITLIASVIVFGLFPDIGSNANR